MSSGGDSLVRQQRFGNFENLDGNNAIKYLYFGAICNTLEQDIMKNENKEMIWKDRQAVKGKYSSDN